MEFKLDPFFNYIDSGKFFRQPFKYLYYIIGVLCLIFPIYVLIKLIDSGIFSVFSASVIFAVILVWLLLVAVMIGLFMLWFNRAQRLNILLPEQTKFVAVPVLANFIQTLGEAVGLFVSVFGFVATLIVVLFSLASPEIQYVMGYVGLPVGVSFMGAVYLLIVGVVIMLGSRFFSEMVLAIADIANKTDLIARKIEDKEV